MSKHWSVIEEKLKKLNVKDRTRLFNEFVDQHPRWIDRTIESLRLVVVKLKSQATVTKELDLQKQIVNRAVMHYKKFLTKKKII
jgi:hypothetical protein